MYVRTYLLDTSKQTCWLCNLLYIRKYTQAMQLLLRMCFAESNWYFNNHVNF